MKKLFLLVLIFFAGCATRGYDEYFLSISDSLGNEVHVSENPTRVVVASGSLADVWQLAGGMVYAATNDAFENEFVTDAVNIGGLHSPSLENILATEPCFVILSANINGHLALQEPLNALGISTAFFGISEFSDYLFALSAMTEITGRADLFEANGMAIARRIDEFVAKSQGEQSPTVLLLRASAGGVEARNSDNSAGAILRNMNAVNIADSESGLLENLSMEVIIQQDPDFIFAVTMGASEEAALAALEEVLYSNPAWAGLTAVREGRYIMLPRELFHLQPNNRWADAYEIIWENLYGQ
jgi:iron complex transport system substrate-binding protein